MDTFLHIEFNLSTGKQWNELFAASIAVSNWISIIISKNQIHKLRLVMKKKKKKKIGRKLYKLWLYKEMKYVCYALRTYYRFWGKCPLKWNGNSIEKANTYTCEWEWRQNIQKSNRRKTDNRITHICAIVV